MKLRRCIFSIYVSVLLMISCDNGNADLNESVSPIVATTLPDTAPAGKKLIFTIDHQVFNGCGQYSRHETKVRGMDVFVTFYAMYPSEGNCTDDIPTRTTQYEFRSTMPGKMTFYFTQGYGFITREIMFY